MVNLCSQYLLSNGLISIDCVARQHVWASPGRERALVRTGQAAGVISFAHALELPGALGGRDELAPRVDYMLVYESTHV